MRGCCCGRHRSGGRWEGDKEAVAGGIHLYPAVLCPDLAQETLVLNQDVSIGITQALEQAGTALDVGEEEGDCTGGEGGRCSWI